MLKLFVHDTVYRYQLFNTRGEFTSSFAAIHSYYEGYLELMDHWREAYPGQIRTLHYEQLVQSPETQVPALLDFCGLENEPGCLEFYKHERAVTTPSASGVKQPMYTSSIGQWRNYEAFAREDMERLASLLE